MLSNKERDKTTKLGSNVVQELKINQRRILIDSLEIGIPAPQQMIALGERQLPNGVKVGQLLNSKTLNYKKFTPHRDGLFCERIFGPVQSFVCACGKKKESVQSKSRQKDIVKANLLPPPAGISVPEVAPLSQIDTLFCPKCQVEYISKNVRRHRLGHIKLFAPVTHIWYLKGRPSYLSLFLGKRKKVMTSLAYCNAYLVEQVYSDLETQNLLKDTDKFVSTSLGKGNVKIWKKSNLPCKELENKSNTLVIGNDQNDQNGKDKSVKKIDDFFSSSLREEPRVVQKGVTKQSFVSTNKKVNGVKRSPTTWKDIDLNREPGSHLKILLNQGVQPSNLIGKKLRYKVSTRLESIKYLSETAFRVSVERGVTESFQRKSKSFIGVPNQQPSKASFVIRTPYIRAQSLPFLPSLICPFQLRDRLISFLQSLPCQEDIPIPLYCQTPRRYPLRDVHKFLAELRSTNLTNQSESLTNESITRFKGSSKQVRSFIAPCPEGRNASFLRENQEDSKDRILANRKQSLSKQVFLTNSQKKQSTTEMPYLLSCKNQVFASKHLTKVCNKTLTKPPVLLPVLAQKENKDFGFVTGKELEKKSFAFGTDKATVFWRAGAKASTGEYLILSTNPSVGVIKRFQQQSDQSLRKQYKKSGFAQQCKKKRLTETNQSFVTSFAQTLKKQALLPLSLCFVGCSSLVRKRFISLAKTDSKILTKPYNKTLTKPPVLYKTFVLNPIVLALNGTTLKTKALLLLRLCLQKPLFLHNKGFASRQPQLRFYKATLFKKDIPESFIFDPTSSTNEFLHTERTLLHFSEQAQSLARETRTSLKGVLLNTFLDIILTGLVDLSLPATIKRFQTSGVKQSVSRDQDGQTIRQLNAQTGLARTGNKTLTKPSVLLQIFVKCLVAKPPVLQPSKQNKTKAKLLSRQSENQDIVSSYLQDFLFKNKIDTYQARLLHIVFGTLSQGICLSPLARTKSSFLQELSGERPCLENKSKGFVKTYKTFLLERQIGTNVKDFKKLKFIQDKGFSKFDCVYLLSKYQQEQKQGFVKTSLGLFTKTEFLQTIKHNQSITKPKLLLALCAALLIKASNNKTLTKPISLLQSSVTQSKIDLLDNLSYVSLFEQSSKIEDRTKLKLGERIKLRYDQLKNLTDFSLAKNDKALVGVKQSKALLSFAKTESFVSQKEVNLDRSFVTPMPPGSETISKWHTSGAKEILLYTGGGALESLLKRFNTSLFCQFLLGEIQILRKHYKDQIVRDYNKNQITKKHGFESPVRDGLVNRYNQDIYLEKNKSDLALALKSSENEHSNQVVNDRNFTQTETQTGHNLELKYLVTDKNANLFCRRIYRTTRRLKIVQLLMRSKRRPEWMMISVLPVLPPDLRPVLQMGDNLIVASDLNTLYQRVIYRNNRHYKGRFLDFHFVSSIHRLVQDAVDRLIENGKSGSTPFLTPGGRPLKSLSDILKGKRGRFRFNLLGKRVDFSGRSVIVVSPNLKIHECGLPREMALELYKYLLIRQLLLQKRVSSIVNAKKLIKQRKPFIWDTLREIIYYHPLLLNRAPTLHRLGIQAFQPKLALGNAILLHPLVCAGFNADFDGDQMGVHLPLSPQARAEAWDLLWSRNNLLSPATGQPILLPSQDMVLGFYYMTSLLPYGTTNKCLLALTGTTFRFGTQGVLKEKDKNKIDLPVVHVFSDQSQVIYAYQKKQIDIHTPIWLKWAGKSENGEKNQAPLEIRIDIFGYRTQIYSTHQFKMKTCKDTDIDLFALHVRTTAGRVLVNNLIGKHH